MIRPWWRSVAAALALCLVSTPAFAVRWDTYSNANPLNAVHWTPGGVWCASDFGLNRFDPATSRFTRINKDVGALASSSIADVAVDAGGDTWFATEDRGVSVLRRLGTWRTLSAFDGLPSDAATCLAPSAFGMWVGTSHGLALFNGFTVTAVWPDGVNPSPFTSNLIHAIALTTDSTYVATGDGVYVTRTSEGVTWDRRTGGLVASDVPSLTALGDEVWCVAGGTVERGGQTGTWTPATAGLGGATASYLLARNGVLVLGTSNGVFRWDAGSSTWQPLGTSGFPKFAHPEIDASSGVWAGNPDGLWRWTGTAWNLYLSPGPSGNWVQGMQLVGSTLYIATRDRGLSRFRNDAWRSYYPLAGATRDTTMLGTGSNFGLLAARDGTLWAGEWGESVAHLDFTTDPPQVTHYYDPQDPAVPYDVRNSLVWSSAQDPSGNVWLGYDTFLQTIVIPIGINELRTDGTRTNYSPFNGAAMAGPQIRSLTFAPGPAFEMWVGYASAGLDIFTDPTLATRAGRFSKVDGAPNNNLTSDDLWGVAFNGDSIWVATSDGLALYSHRTLTRRDVIPTASPSPQGAVHPLSIDGAGGVWWATGGGVFHRAPDRTNEVFDADNSPLLSNDVHSVIADPLTGDVWIGTVLGVNRYNATAPPAGGVVVVPRTFGIYPNPAPLSAIGLGLHAVDLAGPFLGQVYDVRGRIVKQLLGNATSGSLWDGTDEKGRAVGPGLYFLRVEAGGQTRIGRVVLLR